MLKTVFHISKMDCPSEENLIRMKLNDFTTIKNLDFDLSKRELTVYHTENSVQIEQSINDLGLGAKKIGTYQTTQTSFKEQTNQKKLLWTVLLINFIFFLIEITTGLFSKSMGLVSDSLDMLADSFVYGISLFAISGTVTRKKRVAKTAGYFQITLAIIGLLEVIRRFATSETIPHFSTMIIVSIFALIGNITCLYLLQKSRSKEAHMQASMIFTSNDIVINSGVIIAGILVNWLNSVYPDLIIGTIVFIIVIQGAIRILKLG